MAAVMTLEAGLTLVILIATLLALASRRLRPDLTAVCATLALILTGVLSPVEAFSAFGQPVIIIIACIYVLGAALYETGVATMIANRLVRVSDRGPAVLLLVLMLTAGLLSSVLSSMLVIAVLMPAVLRIVRQGEEPQSTQSSSQVSTVSGIGLAPAQLLLPLAAGATMGSLLTLIGTVSNVVVGDLLAASGHGPLGFFSLTPVGFASLALAIVWFLLVGRRLLGKEMPAEPRRPSLAEVEHAYRLDDLLYRLRVRSVSDLIARRLDDTGLSTTHELNVLAVQPQRGSLKPARQDWILERDDTLIVEGARGQILQAASLYQLEPKGTMSLEEFNRLEEETLRLAELMVPFRSQLVGRTLAECDFRDRYGLNVLAVHRQGEAIRQDLPHLTLAAGDALLVQGPLAYLRQIGRDLNLVLVTHLGPEPGDLITRKAKVTLGILALMVVGVVSGVVSLATAGLAAAVALILTGCIPLSRAYRSINGSVIVLIGGMLPLAMALEKTGAAAAIAGQLAKLGPAIGPLGTLLLLYLFTSGLTQVVANSATAALVTPIAINLASTLGLAPQAFALAMAVAVTTSYVTPLTNADNLLVRQAGGYTMRDYLVNGVPVFVLQTAALMLMLVLQGL
jgi:di/tricarboxylate transporter